MHHRKEYQLSRVPYQEQSLSIRSNQKPNKANNKIQKHEKTRPKLTTPQKPIHGALKEKKAKTHTAELFERKTEE